LLLLLLLLFFFFFFFLLLLLNQDSTKVPFQGYVNGYFSLNINSDKVKEDQMGKACSMHGMDMYITF
jgi:hypothetical protein